MRRGKGVTPRPVSSAAKRTLSMLEIPGLNSQACQIGTVSPKAGHRCDVFWSGVAQAL